MIKSELLAPAGSLRNMKYAFAYGADAVYAGQPRYSLRVRKNEFNHMEKIEAGIQYAHKLGRQFYIASNISPHNDKVRTYLDDMQTVVSMGPDAIIMSDPGLIMLVREKWPDLPIHLSVQANAVNWATVKFWQKMGLTRVILSRELSLDEIEEIRQRCPDMELEVFVHGALCIAYSGRCLLSGYMTHRDSNQGACTNACRWQYQAHEARDTDSGDIVVKHPAVQSCEPESLGVKAEIDQVFLLQEKNRPDDYMPAYEDEHGTYIMNSKDLRAVQHIQRLMDIGVESLKIEGRTKSHYYVARTSQVYRRAINDALAAKPFDKTLMVELDGLASRGYTEGFYRRHVPEEYQNYTQGNSLPTRQQFVGEVTAYDESCGQLTIAVKNHFAQADSVELITPQGNLVFQIQSLSTEEGVEVDTAPGSGYIVKLQLPKNDLSADSIEYGLLLKNFA